MTRILVVEDNPDSLYLASEILRVLGHEVDSAASGEEAQALLAARTFDILFTDISLPGISGIVLARMAHQHDPGLRIVFASGYGDSLTRALDFPATTIRKPYDLDQLQKALAT